MHQGHFIESNSVHLSVALGLGIAMRNAQKGSLQWLMLPEKFMLTEVSKESSNRVIEFLF